MYINTDLKKWEIWIFQIWKAQISDQLTQYRTSTLVHKPIVIKTPLGEKGGKILPFFRRRHLWTTPIVVYLTFKSVTMAAKSNPFDYYTFYCILMWDASCYCLPAGQKWCLDVSYLLLLRFKSAADLACNLRLPNILLGCNILVDLCKVQKILKDSLVSIPSPSPLVKI